jgi:hypothetical protein
MIHVSWIRQDLLVPARLFDHVHVAQILRRIRLRILLVSVFYHSRLTLTSMDIYFGIQGTSII